MLAIQVVEIMKFCQLTVMRLKGEDMLVLFPMDIALGNIIPLFCMKKIRPSRVPLIYGDDVLTK